MSLWRLFGGKRNVSKIMVYDIVLKRIDIMVNSNYNLFLI